MTTDTDKASDKLVDWLDANCHFTVSSPNDKTWELRDDQVSEIRAATIADLCGDVEPVAFMYPSDLAEFERKEMVAEAVSVSCTSVVTHERTVPLYSASTVAALKAERDAALARVAVLEKRKDGAYEERNKVVAALAKVFPSGIAKTAIEGWSEDWHGCVYIDLPTGQVSWHFHDSQAALFAALPAYAGQWDGHDTPEKYRRLAALVAIEEWEGPRSDVVNPIGWLYDWTSSSALGRPDKHFTGFTTEKEYALRHDNARPVYDRPIFSAKKQTEMVDAAMTEMQNIHPPLRRSECARLIRAALTKGQP